MKKLNFFTTLLLLLVVFVALTSFIFDMSGPKFWLELIVLLILLFLAIISMVLVFNRIGLGYGMSAVISAIALLNLVAIFYRGRYMTSLLFLGIVAAMTAFVVSIVNIGSRRSFGPAPVLETYEGRKNAAKKKKAKKKKKKAKKK